MTCRTAKGNEYQLAPSAASVPPPAVEAVVDAIVKQFPWMDLFVADHNHGDASEGAWSIAYEGHYDWPVEFTAAQHRVRTAPASMFLEPIAGWCLGVYPTTDADAMADVFRSATPSEYARTLHVTDSKRVVLVAETLIDMYGGRRYALQSRCDQPAPLDWMPEAIIHSEHTAAEWVLLP